ncbi:hypothetical protein X740_12385 [Mesorhizobium sp. LNHC221B00]|nr:hypothetical protein X740_12385 [Mesorhizobium sp. LNHC221B00]
MDHDGTIVAFVAQVKPLPAISKGIAIMAIKADEPCYRLTFDDAVAVQIELINGEKQSRIAARYDTNGGRISEVNTGKLHPGSRAEALRRLNS